MAGTDTLDSRPWELSNKHVSREVDVVALKEYKFRRVGSYAILSPTDNAMYIS